MTSATYKLFRNAILAEQQVICIYKDHHRELCPHIIGYDKDGEEAVLNWQFAGSTSKGALPPGGQWRCLKIAGVSNVNTRDGAWHTGAYHRSTQVCVAEIDLDINMHVRRGR
jgi:hypothetical protein